MEEILEKTGPWHYPVLLLTVLEGFPCAWRIMALQFMAPKNLEYWCARPNSSMSLEQWRTANEGVDLHCFVRLDDGSANETVTKCHSWEYDTSYHQRTLIEEWDAVCDRKWLVDSSQALLMSGSLGTLVFSHISDWYGRRTVLLLSAVLSLTTGLLTSLTSTFWAFSILRMITSAVYIGYYTLAVESVGPSKRALVGLSAEFSWFIGLVTFPIVTYHVRDWKLLQVIVSVPDIIQIFAVLFLIDESPKWLVSARRFDDAKDLLSKIVRRNKVQNIDVTAVVNDVRKRIESEKNENHVSFIDLFRGWSVARATLSCTINYMTVVFVYYHLMYFTVDFGSNPYFNLILIAITEAPISLTSFFVVRFLRRKPMYNVTYPICIASLIALLFSPESATAMCMSFASIAKLTSQVTWTVLYVHMSEMYPTHVRSTVAGFVSTASWFSSVTAPLLRLLGEATVRELPIAITISVCVISWAASSILPETFGQKLPDTFHDSKALLRSVMPAKTGPIGERRHKVAGVSGEPST